MTADRAYLRMVRATPADVEECLEIEGRKRRGWRGATLLAAPRTSSHDGPPAAAARKVFASRKAKGVTRDP